ncbi:MAG TPA: c-type cytochrome [Polyangia bacterium]|nr:c-type cytochrome [Polyangia bacterium]
MTRLGCLLSLTLAACTGKYVRPTTPEKIAVTPELTARGGYLVNQVAACGACHTPRVNLSWLEGERADAYLAGGTFLDDPSYGLAVMVPNITPDAETGIGSWSDDQILRSIRDGVGNKDNLLMPPMPFGTWAHLSDDDAHAIVTYIRSAPPVKNAVDRTHNHFAFGVRFAKSMGFIHHKPAMNVQAPPRSDRVKYGQYLAHGVAPCHDCHSLTSKGPSDDNLFAGAEDPMEERDVGKVWPRNLTPDKETGLGNYTAAQIKQSLRDGKRLDGKTMAPPMSSLIPHLSGMTDEDLDAVVAYLLSIPAKKHKIHERELTPAAQKLVGESGSTGG